MTETSDKPTPDPAAGSPPDVRRADDPTPSSGEPSPAGAEAGTSPPAASETPETPAPETAGESGNARLHASAKVTESPGSSEPSFSSSTTTTSSSGGIWKMLLGMLLVAVLAGIGLAGWQGWMIYQDLQAQRAQQDQAIERLRGDVQGLSGQMQSMQARQSDLSRSVDRRGTELAALQARIDDSLELVSRINENLSGGRARFERAAVEQLLLLANDRLQLHRDVRSALAALDSADQRLAAMADPQLFSVRQALAQERAALRAVSLPDVASAALSLSSLIDRLEHLPLRAHAPTAYASPAARRTVEDGTDAQAPGWQRLLDAVREAIGRLFTVRRDDDARALRLLSPETEVMVYQVLMLKLEGARAALLAGRTVPMRESLASAAQWLDTEFKTDDSGVRAAREDLQRLQGLELAPPLPDISGSLDALRARLDRNSDNTRGDATP